MTGKFPKVHREAGEMRFGLGFLPIEGTRRNLLNHVIVLRNRSPWQASQDRPLWGETRMQISCGTEARSIGFHVRHSSSQKLESVRLQVTYQTPFLITFTLVYSWNERQSGMEAPQSLPLTYLMVVHPKYGASWESSKVRGPPGPKHTELRLYCLSPRYSLYPHISHYSTQEKATSPGPDSHLLGPEIPLVCSRTYPFPCTYTTRPGNFPFVSTGAFHGQAWSWPTMGAKHCILL